MRRTERTTQEAAGDVTRFTDIDRAPDSSFFIGFMDAGNALPDVVRLKRRVIELLLLRPGDRVLDVGCGTGDDARELARVVGERGNVCGADISAAMIDVAIARSHVSGTIADFRKADVFALPFPDASFDACRCERVLMHLDGDPVDAVAEMARVTRPGGRIVLSDFDWDAALVDHPDKHATRLTIQTVSDGIRHGRIGRQLARLLHESGLTDIGVESHGIQLPYDFLRKLLDGHLSAARDQHKLSTERLKAWWQPLSNANDEGRFLAIWTAVLAAGTISSGGADCPR
jgi:SAM-dependent methyltransferase